VARAWRGAGAKPRRFHRRSGATGFQKGEISLTDDNVSDFLGLIEGRLFSDGVMEEERRADTYFSGSADKDSNEHGVRCGRTMSRKQVSGPPDSVDSPSWPPKRSKSSELEERKTWSRP
jgi:hypothetical protein